MFHREHDTTGCQQNVRMVRKATRQLHNTRKRPIHRREKYLLSSKKSFHASTTELLKFGHGYSVGFLRSPNGLNSTNRSINEVHTSPSHPGIAYESTILVTGKRPTYATQSTILKRRHGGIRLVPRQWLWLVIRWIHGVRRRQTLSKEIPVLSPQSLVLLATETCAIAIDSRQHKGEESKRAGRRAGKR